MHFEKGYGLKAFHMEQKKHIYLFGEDSKSTLSNVKAWKSTQRIVQNQANESFYPCIRVHDLYISLKMPTTSLQITHLSEGTLLAKW